MTANWYQNERTRDYLSQVSTATLTTQLFQRGLRTRFIAGVAPIRPGSRMAHLPLSAGTLSDVWTQPTEL